jgi:2-keto-4-pentenoate hydratase/2-oxohepta-3-ene-1,7-dioic acid hydratase in catechol pathway
LSYRGSGQGFYKLQLAYPQGESFNSGGAVLPQFIEAAMRLATIRTAEGPRAAVRRGDIYIDLYATDSTLPGSVRELLSGGPAALQAAQRAAQSRKVISYPADRVQLLSPVPDPRKIVCLGLNYRDHAAESGAPIPKDPILFSKYATALIGQGEAIVLPAISNEVDYEAELVVVVGRQGRHIPVDAALSYVAGYTIGHDVSARDWQLKKDGKQWMAGKTFDTFAPTGPVLVTADEVPAPQALRIQLRLNGQTMQDSNTREMIFSVGFVLSHVSRIFTLQPGDLIFTGTPPGVGMAQKPPVYLKPGDVVEVEIDGLGVLENPVVAQEG